jgi:predicted kinase
MEDNQTNTDVTALMPNIIALCGPSGCGKSTLAAEMARNNPHMVVVSRDAYRAMLFPQYLPSMVEFYTEEGREEREALVTDMINKGIKCALQAGKTVIVDDAHLAERYITRYVKDFRVPVTVLTVELPIEEAIARDKTVGKEVIERQFQQYESLKQTLQPVYYPEPTLEAIK